MKIGKSLNFALGALFIANLGFAIPTFDENSAKKRANEIYFKSADFAQSVSKTYENYEAWRGKELAFLRENGVEFGAWKEFSRPDLKYVCEISTPKKITVGGTLYIPENSEVRLNGKKIAENNTSRRTVNPKAITLELNEGKNELSLVPREPSQWFHYGPYLSPYADPVMDLRKLFARDFPEYTANLAPDTNLYISNNYAHELSRSFSQIIESSLFSAGKMEEAYKAMIASKINPQSIEWLKLYSEIIKTRAVERALAYDVSNLRSAIEYLEKKYADYPKGNLAHLSEFEKEMPRIRRDLENGKDVSEFLKKYHLFARNALLANPLLKKYSDWIYVLRKPGVPENGFPTNWQSQQIIKERHKWSDEIWKMEIAKPESAKRLFSSEKAPAVVDLEVDWDAKKIMFSSLDEKNRWQLFEIDAGGENLRMLTPGLYDDVDSYDGVYLPNGKIVFAYTACHAGVPCNAGIEDVCNLYLMDPNAGSAEAVDKSIRQLTFEQDADWSPAVMNDGRVMYTRWEYTDNSHYFSRILMRMNPDGTAQSAWYGSASY